MPAAAYRAGELLHDVGTGLSHDYTPRSKDRSVMGRGIVHPPGADWAADRELLWNRAELAERRRNSCVAREYEVALPAKIGRPHHVAMIVEFCEWLVAEFGVAVDWALHAGRRGSRNVHAHILTTTRVAGPGGLGRKTRQLDDRVSGGRLIERMREEWAALWNREAAAAGSTERVDHRTYLMQGIDRVPQRRLGKAAAAMERRGIPTRAGDYNRQVRAVNAAKAALAESRGAAIRDQAELEQAVRDRDAAWAAGMQAPSHPRRQAGRRRPTHRFSGLDGMDTARGAGPLEPPLPRDAPAYGAPAFDPLAHAAALEALGQFVQAARQRSAGSGLDAAGVAEMLSGLVASYGPAAADAGQQVTAPDLAARRPGRGQVILPSTPVAGGAGRPARGRTGRTASAGAGGLVAIQMSVLCRTTPVRRRPRIAAAANDRSEVFESMLDLVLRATRPAPKRPDLAWWWASDEIPAGGPFEVLRRRLAAAQVETAFEDIPPLGWGMAARMKDLVVLLLDTETPDGWLQAIADATAASERLRLLREHELKRAGLEEAELEVVRLDGRDAGPGLFGHLAGRARAAAAIAAAAAMPVLRHAGAVVVAEAKDAGAEGAAMAREAGAGVWSLGGTALSFLRDRWAEHPAPEPSPPPQPPLTQPLASPLPEPGQPGILESRVTLVPVPVNSEPGAGEAQRTGLERRIVPAPGMKAGPLGQPKPIGAARAMAGLLAAGVVAPSPDGVWAVLHAPLDLLKGEGAAPDPSVSGLFGLWPALKSLGMRLSGLEELDVRIETHKPLVRRVELRLERLAELLGTLAQVDARQWFDRLERAVAESKAYERDSPDGNGGPPAGTGRAPSALRAPTPKRSRPSRRGDGPTR